MRKCATIHIRFKIRRCIPFFVISLQAARLKVLYIFEQSRFSNPMWLLSSVYCLSISLHFCDVVCA